MTSDMFRWYHGTERRPFFRRENELTAVGCHLGVAVSTNLIGPEVITPQLYLTGAWIGLGGALIFSAGLPWFAY